MLSAVVSPLNALQELAVSYRALLAKLLLRQGFGRGGANGEEERREGRGGEHFGADITAERVSVHEKENQHTNRLTPAPAPAPAPAAPQWVIEGSTNKERSSLGTRTEEEEGSQKVACAG
eukprot:760844-Hanusia_phi.AAC.1